MKNVKRLLSFAVVFMVVMVAFCSVSFAVDEQYTENLIPTMTSNTAPNGVASASDSWSETPAWSAFDKNYMYTTIGTCYTAWGTSNTYGWLAYEFSTPQTITKYTITTSHMGNSPKNWTFEGWNGSQWIVLDTRTNITNWSTTITKKEFSIINSVAYKKYRINISSNAGQTNDGVNLIINELEMMGPAAPAISAPTTLIAKSGNYKVDLSWGAVSGATSYNIKRSTTAGGPYTTISTTSSAIYTDTTATNGITYYYIVTAVNASGESAPSKEVSATPKATNQLKLVLEVNEEKQLSVSDELIDNTDLDWTSSYTTIAAIDVNGKIKALKPGNTVINCTSKDKSYTESINVLVVDLTYKLAVDLTVGGTCRLTIDDLANTTNATWSSYDTTIAAVSAKGKVTAISEGLTYVVASDKDGKEIGRIYIRVRK